ncbi:STAS domain-containing protein [Couchioplanes caeruleus]|uniref:Anti-sigma factor antagonist n=2 Tax=Couchioplanes caeruleus TaxID=56438 RepID=A0A1K0GG21_9ACTN|nr:STAS domain-containing protein [Couchioplanes caeruleus]OJF11118.1 hypothetical protein BG844_28690 [Couchioplanes caeruleus subsp. caeruleus]ROP33755.1 anti-anti-sigma factor [Couchioplanes caeruleus]
MNTNLTWQYQIRTDAGHRIVTLSGEIDMIGVERLQELLQDAVRSAELVTVDIAGVGFIDSTVISALVAARNAAHRIGRRFTVINPATHVRRVLHMTGVLDNLTIPHPRRP